MKQLNVEINGRTYESVEQMMRVRELYGEKLQLIFADFDPARIEQYLPQEAQIIAYFNGYHELTVAIERAKEVEEREQNIMTAWKLVRDLKGGSR